MAKVSSLVRASSAALNDSDDFLTCTYTLWMHNFFSSQSDFYHSNSKSKILRLTLRKDVFLVKTNKLIECMPKWIIPFLNDVSADAYSKITHYMQREVGEFLQISSKGPLRGGSPENLVEVCKSFPEFSKVALSLWTEEQSGPALSELFRTIFIILINKISLTWLKDRKYCTFLSRLLMEVHSFYFYYNKYLPLSESERDDGRNPVVVAMSSHITMLCVILGRDSKDPIGSEWFQTMLDKEMKDISSIVETASYQRFYLCAEAEMCMNRMQEQERHVNALKSLVLIYRSNHETTEIMMKQIKAMRSLPSNRLHLTEEELTKIRSGLNSTEVILSLYEEGEVHEDEVLSQDSIDNKPALQIEQDSGVNAVENIDATLARILQQGLIHPPLESPAVEQTGNYKCFQIDLVIGEEHEEEELAQKKKKSQSKRRKEIKMAQAAQIAACLSDICDAVEKEAHRVFVLDTVECILGDIVSEAVFKAEETISKNAQTRVLSDAQGDRGLEPEFAAAITQTIVSDRALVQHVLPIMSSHPSFVQEILGTLLPGLNILQPTIECTFCLKPLNFTEGRIDEITHRHLTCCDAVLFVCAECIQLHRETKMHKEPVVEEKGIVCLVASIRRQLHLD